jgi:hypothetical protein
MYLGTLNFQPRVHKYNILFTPNTTATIENPSGKNIHFWYQETIRFYGPDGQPVCTRGDSQNMYYEETDNFQQATGLDADANGYLTYPGYPPLPAATYPGDGFGGPGPGGKRVSVDVEGLVIDARDGSFWISDEYGPYLYHCRHSHVIQCSLYHIVETHVSGTSLVLLQSPKLTFVTPTVDSVGKMIGAIQPPAAYLPLRNGSLSFSSNNPPYYDQDRKLNPVDGPSGRMNNRGLEGLTIDGSGRNLYALMQGALNQEGGLTKQTERHARLLKYDITVASKPRYAREYVVPLPYWIDPTSKSAAKARKVAAQSEILHVQNGQFFVLARDSGSGHGADQTTSQYRHIDIFDINSATDIKSAKYDCSNCSIASVEGVLKPEITAATYCPFIDFNINSQLNRFGVHNGGNQDAGLLNEKWESLAIVPVDGKVGDDDEWFVLAISDNDFITQDGYLKDGEYRYTDSSGYNVSDNFVI